MKPLEKLTLNVTVLRKAIYVVTICGDSLFFFKYLTVKKVSGFIQGSKETLEL